MIGSLVAVGCRALVAMVFVLTAGWKISNRGQFESSFERLAPRWAGPFGRFALFPLAATEMALSAVLLVGIRVRILSLVGPAAAFALIGIFTVALTLGEEGGCGCWSTPAEHRRSAKLTPIFRNLALLIALVGAGALSWQGVHGVAFSAGTAPFVSGLLVAVLLVEAPQLVEVAAFRRGPVGAGGGR